MNARLELRCSDEEKDRWREAAKKDGFEWDGQGNISEWLRHLANAASAQKPRVAAAR